MSSIDGCDVDACCQEEVYPDRCRRGPTAVGRRKMRAEARPHRCHSVTCPGHEARPSVSKTDHVSVSKLSSKPTPAYASTVRFSKRPGRLNYFYQTTKSAHVFRIARRGDPGAGALEGTRLSELAGRAADRELWPAKKGSKNRACGAVWAATGRRILHKSRPGTADQGQPKKTSFNTRAPGARLLPGVWVHPRI